MKKLNLQPKLFIVHCIDTEGPLHEPLEATFQRLKQIYNIDLEATQENLEKIQNKKIDFGKHTTSIANSFSKQLLSYNNTWDKIDNMLDKIMCPKYRNSFKDSLGNGNVYNWHCMDNVGFDTNPRRRDIGFGNIFTHYKRKVNENKNLDTIHWHFHPLSFKKEGHICSTSYVNSYNILYEILCRRLIDHDWFPIVNRAGFHAIRQDSNLFLEQWIPFDYSNQSTYDTNFEQNDVNRYGDWRRATKKWVPYNPSYNDYQVPGSMNRFTTKCLNLGTRFKLLTNEEIEAAFQDATENGSAILAFTNHDCRDMSLDIEDVYYRINKIHKNYENVIRINSDAIKAMQQTVYNEETLKTPPIKLNVKKVVENKVNKIVVNVQQGKIFGAQPFLAIKTLDGQYFHDNFNEKEHLKSWEYILDDSSLTLDSIKKIAVASNDKIGRQSIASIEF